MNSEHSTSSASGVTHSILDDILEGRETSPTPEQRREAMLELLKRWREEDDAEEEQSETWEYLKKALDEDRLSYRKLFP